MNPVFKIINNLIISINNIIDSMNLRTVQTIKRGFFFFTFLMCIAGIIIGYNMGTKAARIKSPPLAEFVNDTFINDISRERDTGSFSGMIESEIIKESDAINSNKIDFFVRERLETQKDDRIIDSGKSVEGPFTGEKVYKPETPVDNDIRNREADDSKINILERDVKTETGRDIIIQNKTDNSTPVTDKTGNEKADIRMLEKDRTYKPETIQKDMGTPEQ